jgi:hypothetical protein
LPGQVTETTLTFDRPGTHTYYCTRWCGPNHWRMRGTIEVVDEEAEATAVALAPAPFYISLGIDMTLPMIRPWQCRARLRPHEAPL